MKRMDRNRQFRVAIRKFAPFESAIQKQWAHFEEAMHTGLELQTVALDLHPLYEALIGSEGLQNGDWDVAFLSTDWMRNIFASKLVVDLAPLIERNPPEGFPNGWTRSLLRLQEIEGKILGLPYHDGPECLIYRRDLFEDPSERRRYEDQFGTTLRPPETWAEFQRVASFFQRPENGLYGTVFAAYPDGHNTVYDFLLQLWTRGGELFDSSGVLCFDTAEAIEGLQFYRSLLKGGGPVHPSSKEFDSVQAGFAFARGEVAMMVNWFGFAAMAEALAESRVRKTVDIASVPRAIDGRHISLNAYWVLGLASATPHRETGYAFIRHCASQAMDKLLTCEGGIGCRKSTWADPDVNAITPFYARLEDLHALAREIPRIPEWPVIGSRIDALVMAVINSDRPIEELVQEI